MTAFRLGELGDDMLLDGTRTILRGGIPESVAEAKWMAESIAIDAAANRLSMSDIMTISMAAARIAKSGVSWASHLEAAAGLERQLDAGIQKHSPNRQYKPGPGSDIRPAVCWFEPPFAKTETVLRDGFPVDNLMRFLDLYGSVESDMVGGRLTAKQLDIIEHRLDEAALTNGAKAKIVDEALGYLSSMQNDRRKMRPDGPNRSMIRPREEWAVIMAGYRELNCADCRELTWGYRQDGPKNRLNWTCCECLERRITQQ